ncbi:MAG TPA: peptidoglycan recognition family protein [Chitinispirillaceae bacterium]|nr:peptidoglycan recognition family protein [Chitinispirillaceae bacterium]
MTLCLVIGLLFGYSISLKEKSTKQFTVQQKQNSDYQPPEPTEVRSETEDKPVQNLPVGKNKNCQEGTTSTPEKQRIVAESTKYIDDKSGSSSETQEIKVDKTRMRKNLERWKKEIQGYSKRHYGEDTYVLHPSVIVLHYTATSGFPMNLVESTQSDGEKPGLASHYVIENDKIYQILPIEFKSRAAYGINHRAINIEMVALNSDDLARRKNTLTACARLVKYLMYEYGIPTKKIYSHEAVSRMDRRIVPDVMDLVNNKAYGKSDPGEKNMKEILNLLNILNKETL